MTLGSRPKPRRSFGKTSGTSDRLLPEEVPIAIVYNGSTQAVMMATPLNLQDFAFGFTLTEGIAEPSEIETVEPVQVDAGIDLRIWLRPEADLRLIERRRSMLGPVGCGLCGIDSLEQAARQPKMVPQGQLRLTPDQVIAAIESLPSGQRLHEATRAVHAAGYWADGLKAVREDVGRHNALDKLAGFLVQHPQPEGAVLITSRVSIDIVQKVAAMGAGLLVAVSAPTASAVEFAEAAGITLIASARTGGFDLYTHPYRIITEDEGGR